MRAVGPWVQLNHYLSGLVTICQHFHARMTGQAVPTTAHQWPSMPTNTDFKPTLLMHRPPTSHDLKPTSHASCNKMATRQVLLLLLTPPPTTTMPAAVRVSIRDDVWTGMLTCPHVLPHAHLPSTSGRDGQEG